MENSSCEEQLSTFSIYGGLLPWGRQIESRQISDSDRGRVPEIQGLSYFGSILQRHAEIDTEIRNWRSKAWFKWREVRPLLLYRAEDFCYSQEIRAMAELGGTANAQMDEDTWKEFYELSLRPFLIQYRKFLDHGNSRYLLGPRLTYADIALAETLSLLTECYNTAALYELEDLEFFMKRVFDFPVIKQYVANHVC
ncbi:unnamed protein product [Soboliphyme baturini]|uniref:GST_C domain-containing protein n=1 Tax=Soboliphyme baturini TaxID=241478 RepID=A0A183IAJ4_9BILA|nr:unnamed protein product [Soboliphyme baturini]